MAAPRNGRNVVSRKMTIWVGHYEPLELFCLWTKVHQFSFVQRGRGSGWWFFFRCSICRSVPETFAIKVESCQNNCAEIWTFFWPSEILGGGPSKSCTRVIIPASLYVIMENFREDTHTSPEVIEAHTLNFKPNFKFSRLKVFWGYPRPRLGGR